MNNININDEVFLVKTSDYNEVCRSLKGRILRVLFLRDDISNKIRTVDEVNKYITTLIWDLYGAYVVFQNYKFLNAICELQGIKENLEDFFARKKILDLGNFVGSISKGSD